MTVFKEGDLVRVITRRHGTEQHNDIGVVIRYCSDSELPYWVKFVGDHRCVNKQDMSQNSYNEDDLRLEYEFKPYDPNQEPEDDCI